MDLTTALFFWYVGYWVWIGLLFDYDDNDDERLDVRQHILWLLYPVAIPFLIMRYLTRGAYNATRAFIEDIEAKL